MKSFLLHEGTDPRYGARHLKRAIERHLVFPLANLVATGQIHLGDFVRMKFMTSSIEYFGRWLLMYSSYVRIESPEPLKTVMKDLSQRLYTHYADC